VRLAVSMTQATTVVVVLTNHVGIDLSAVAERLIDASTTG